MIKVNRYLEVLDRALAADVGVEVIIPDPKTQISIRSKLYTYRRENSVYQCLSIVEARDKTPNLWIIKNPEAEADEEE